MNFIFRPEFIEFFGLNTSLANDDKMNNDGTKANSNDADDPSTPVN